MTSNFFCLVYIKGESSDGDAPGPSRKTPPRKRTAKVAALKSAFVEEDGDEVFVNLSSMNSSQKKKKTSGKKFRCILGENYEVQVNPEFFGFPYLSSRQWIHEEGGKSSPGKGLTLKLLYLPKLIAALEAAKAHCDKFEMWVQ